MIYDYISSYCERKKITIAELEEKAGLSNSSIKKWEGGKVQPSLPKLKQLADAMGVPLTTLVKEWEK